MVKTTTALRAQLRARYMHHRSSIGNPEPESGFFKWLYSGLRREKGKMIVGDSMVGRGGKADRFALTLLTAIDDDEELGFLCQSLGLRRALTRVPGDARDEWSISWPGGATVPHNLKRSMTTLVLFVQVLDAWIDHLAEGAPDIDGLTPNARAFLKAMLALKLHDGTRAGQDEIWAKVAELGDAVEGKSNREAAVGILKHRKLIEPKHGTGTILTTAGLSLARSLSSRSNPE